MVKTNENWSNVLNVLIIFVRASKVSKLTVELSSHQ